MPVRRQRARYASAQPETPEILPAVRLWILRMLVPLGGQRAYIRDDGFSGELLAELLGLKPWTNPEFEDFDPKAIRGRLRKLHQQAEKDYRNAGLPECVSSNLGRLIRLVGLSAAQCRLLEFAVMLKTESWLSSVSNSLGDLSTSEAFRSLSVVLALPEPEIRRALSSQAALVQSGLVSLDQDCNLPLGDKLNVLSNKFADQFTSSDADPIALLRDMVSPSAPAGLGLSDYQHIAASLAVLLPYLGQALSTERKGVNVLIYGAPGTGKSQLTKVLAEALGCELLEVASEDEGGDPVDGEQRLRAFRAAQYFFGQRGSMLLFDEAEDIFNDGGHGFGRKSTAQTHKGWLNRMLENNRIPALWISNTVSCLDPAFVRRFDMILELPVPPKSQRVRIIEGTCEGLLDPRVIDRLADSEVLTPAIVSRAASVVQFIRPDLDGLDAASTIELLINHTLEAQGHPPIRKVSSGGMPEVYDPALIDADVDLAEVAAGLVRSETGRLCLYGPPGTGKTAYGHWLARRLDARLYVRRASDLMSKWLGESERNIANAFREAEQERAVFLLDEVDSFLQDRRGSRHSWEISLVNEMLTQMESFSGVFVASTNLMDNLDQAALRRFDLKLRFGYLKQHQAWDLLCRHCRTLELGTPAVSLRARLDRVRNLTPGDFATVVRQNRFRELSGPDGFITALETECMLKDGPKNAPGFL